MDAYDKLSFTQEFYKVYLMTETKIITLILETMLFKSGEGRGI